jgi:hypothetical protein
MLPPHLAIHDHSHEHARRDLELAHDEDVARAPLIVDGDVNVLRIIIRMTDDPRARWDLGARPVTFHRRRLVTCRAIRIPDAAFAGWRIVALGDVEPGVPASLEIRVTVALAIVVAFVAYRAGTLFRLLGFASLLSGPYRSDTATGDGNRESE